ncbi:hypothetical protein EYF80_006226 [Liparis tanakae]|uniref:Uncharacterized protein n=1 Tax=Liparis tanakae TaxID=230148 RepID=A0A4Z2J1X4_9TELE|nr:hypothetical protein EYF80_006226 [Liparis tanakae]
MRGKGHEGEGDSEIMEVKRRDGGFMIDETRKQAAFRGPGFTSCLGQSVASRADQTTEGEPGLLFKQALRLQLQLNSVFLVVQEILQLQDKELAVNGLLGVFLLMLLQHYE